MKSKMFHRKLVLKKTTVAHLSHEKMSRMNGGVVLTILQTNCDTCDIYTPEPWCPPDVTGGPYTACICPQTINCDVSTNGCDSEWLGKSCQTCFTYGMVSECGC